MILHSVFFYLNDKAAIDTAENMKTEILSDLAHIEAVREFWAGPPEGIERDVVDNDYAMSLHALFEDKSALQAYQTDKLHVAFVDKYKPFFKRIRVFDTRV